MRKCLTLTAFLSCVVSTTQATTHWQTYARLGFSDYIIQNTQGQKLTIACNRNAGSQFHHESFGISQYRTPSTFSINY